MGVQRADVPPDASRRLGPLFGGQLATELAPDLPGLAQRSRSPEWAAASAALSAESCAIRRIHSHDISMPKYRPQRVARPILSQGSFSVLVMRLLHTSDWHLGRMLHRADLRDAQAGFLDSLVETVRSERVDVVLVAGDIYDRAIPPVDAISLCEDVLVRLREAGAKVIVSSGNHDSACRLGFGSRLVDGSGVYLRTRPAAVAKPVILHDEHGQVACYAVPYLEPEAVSAELPADPVATVGTLREPPRGHAAVLARATACIRADVASRGNPRSVVLAHAWVTGGAGSDSERDITVGGVGCVPAETFTGFDYTALGHLHGQQTLAPALRYSGSPLPYSFSEAHHRKGSWLVELGAAGRLSAERVPAPTYRPLSALRGTLDELLNPRRFVGTEKHFISATLTDPTRPGEAMDRLRLRFPHILVLSWEPTGLAPDGRSYRARTRGRDDLGIATAFVPHVRGLPASEAERQLLTAALQASRLTGVLDGALPAVFSSAPDGAGYLPVAAEVA
jgi:DNA repair protein SbcD/Mre11